MKKQACVLGVALALCIGLMLTGCGAKTTDSASFAARFMEQHSAKVEAFFGQQQIAGLATKGDGQLYAADLSNDGQPEVVLSVAVAAGTGTSRYFKVLDANTGEEQGHFYATSINSVWRAQKWVESANGEVNIGTVFVAEERLQTAETEACAFFWEYPYEVDPIPAFVMLSWQNPADDYTSETVIGVNSYYKAGWASACRAGEPFLKGVQKSSEPAQTVWYFNSFERIEKLDYVALGSFEAGFEPSQAVELTGRFALPQEKLQQDERALALQFVRQHPKLVYDFCNRWEIDGVDTQAGGKIWFCDFNGDGTLETVLSIIYRCGAAFTDYNQVFDTKTGEPLGEPFTGYSGGMWKVTQNGMPFFVICQDVPGGSSGNSQLFWEYQLDKPIFLRFELDNSRNFDNNTYELGLYEEEEAPAGGAPAACSRGYSDAVWQAATPVSAARLLDYIAQFPVREQASNGTAGWFDVWWEDPDQHVLDFRWSWDSREPAVLRVEPKADGSGFDVYDLEPAPSPTPKP